MKKWKMSWPQGVIFWLTLYITPRYGPLQQRQKILLAGTLAAVGRWYCTWGLSDVWCLYRGGTRVTINGRHLRSVAVPRIILSVYVIRFNNSVGTVTNIFRRSEVTSYPQHITIQCQRKRVRVLSDVLNRFTMWNAVYDILNMCRRPSVCLSHFCMDCVEAV